MLPLQRPTRTPHFAKHIVQIDVHPNAILWPSPGMEDLKTGTWLDLSGPEVELPRPRPAPAAAAPVGRRKKAG
jgi:hypothetical protein